MIAIYRCLYGEDFIQDSILAIEPYVDHIYVFWDNVPWGESTSVTYKNQVIVFPTQFDHILYKIDELNLGNKISCIYDHVFTPVNQLTKLTNTYIVSDFGTNIELLFIEVDHVFREDQIKSAIEQFQHSKYRCATTRQIEIWKGLKHRIPERVYRTGVVFWRLDGLSEMPPTLHQANIKNMPILDAYVHNFGFAVSAKTMYWKHLTALSFAKKIKDSIPNENWYEDKWLTWDYDTNNTDLEISIGKEHLIPHAIPYDISQLPKSIQERIR